MQSYGHLALLLDKNTLCNLLLFRSNDLNIVKNRIIIEATIYFIEAIKRPDLLIRM